MNNIAEKINRFNCYLGSADAKDRLIGITDEVTLVNFEAMSETLSLAGMAGEIDSPSTGQFKSAQVELTFTNISEESLRAAADDSKAIILRSAQEVLNTETLAKSHVGRVTTIRGMTKSIDYGKLKKGGYGNPKIKKEVVYYKEELDGEVITEIDKINGKCVINGVDIAPDIESLI